MSARERFVATGNFAGDNRRTNLPLRRIIGCRDRRIVEEGE